MLCNAGPLPEVPEVWTINLSYSKANENYWPDQLRSKMKQAKHFGGASEAEQIQPAIAVYR
jgi:hypothetical protein